MPSPQAKLRADALQIWQAGLDAVRSDQLVRNNLQVLGDRLVFGRPGDEQQVVELDRIHRIAVVGAGKAGRGMARAVEQALGPDLMRAKHVTGWVNVPGPPDSRISDDCGEPDRAQRATARQSPIHLHIGRPAGRNEPTEQGVHGAEQILKIVGDLGPDDLCIALISGGGSALLPAPIEGISLDDKLAVTRFLSAAGADITELNTVRKQLSRIKGGGLARACKAGQLISLIISDVLGDPLEFIASGPTVVDDSSPADAIRVLDRYGARDGGVPDRVYDVLSRRSKQTPATLWFPGRATNLIIGNNATAVEGAANQATMLGYEVYPLAATEPEGDAEEIGANLARYATKPRHVDWPTPLAHIHGGECVVKLAPEGKRGLGGRNQQTVLAALIELSRHDPRGVVILSGGTDGEDGPTDAAGALLDAEVIAEAARRNLDPLDYLQRNDAYHFFEPLGALIKTGPTETNVCDLRIVLVAPPDRP